MTPVRHARDIANLNGWNVKTRPVKRLAHELWNWPYSQIPECTCSISCNAPFWTEMCTFLFWMEHCGIWNKCILEFVKLVYWTFPLIQTVEHDHVSNAIGANHHIALTHRDAWTAESNIKWYWFYNWYGYRFISALKNSSNELICINVC